jgi:hypothetical protein
MNGHPYSRAARFAAVAAKRKSVKFSIATSGRF